MTVNTCVGFVLCAVTATLTQADTIYRCGEAYSTSSQCANAAATEVKPSSALHTTGSDSANTATRDLREAQTLEKQRLQAEQQAAQAAPMRLSSPSAPLVTPSNMAHTEPVANPGKRKGKKTRKTNSSYFTAVDPTAALKKKSTAKAVPAKPASSP